jgi:transposase
VGDELGPDQLIFFIQEIVGKLDCRQFDEFYSDDRRPAYLPQMILKLWLYAYALGVTSSRKIEQRILEDLGFRFLAGGWKPDFWALNEFRRLHPKALNDVTIRQIRPCLPVLIQRDSQGRLSAPTLDCGNKR